MISFPFAELANLSVIIYAYIKTAKLAAFFKYYKKQLLNKMLKSA